MDVHVEQSASTSSPAEPVPQLDVCADREDERVPHALPEEGEEYIADDDEPPMLDDGEEDDEGERRMG